MGNGGGDGQETRRRVAAMGLYLREARERSGRTQCDVADAIGRSYKYVSAVETGTRGGKMDPLTALRWCEYLELDAQRVFYFLGIAEPHRSAEVARYLGTVAWSVQILRAQDALQALRAELDGLRAELDADGGAPMRRVRDVVDNARTLAQQGLRVLRAPRTGSQGPRRRRRAA